MFSIKQLQYALAVEKTLHFKKAAEHCNISQSALSTALNELEKQLGIQIFERDNKKVLVTPMGREVLTHARDIIDRSNVLHTLVDSQSSPLSFPLKIGIIPTIAPYLLPRVLPALQQRYPDAKLNIIEEQSNVLVERVRNGELDSGILALPYDTSGLLTLTFWQEDFYWVAAKGSGEAPVQEISSDEMANKHLLLLNEGHCLKDHIVEVCQLSALQQNEEHIALGATSLSTLIQMVRGNMGSTLIPEMALEELTGRNDDLIAAHLSAPSPHREIAFVMRPNYTRMNSLEALKQVCHDALQNALPR